MAHGGPCASGSFIQTLVLTDIASGWTECAPLLVREQVLVTEVLDEVRKVLPFDLPGLDTDNDTAFMNETVRDYCAAAGVEFTRCRPYRKNDQAFVEQKNGAVVRRIVGYRRLEGLEAAAALAELYRSARLFVNFFQPSFKLAEKSRDGAVVRWCGSGITHRPHRTSGCSRTRGCRTRSGRVCGPWPRVWIRCSCCATSVRRSSVLSRSPTGPASASMGRRRSRPWRSSSRGCVRLGAEARCARRRRRNPRRREGVGGRIRSPR